MSATRRDILKLAAGGVALPLFERTLEAAATLVRFPYVQDVRTDRATLVWTTREAGQASVQFSADPGFPRPTVVPAASRRFPAAETGLSSDFSQHQAELRNLAPDAKYYYRAYLDGENLTPRPSPADEELSFRSAPLSGSFRFLAFGDSGSGSSEQFVLALRMTADQPALVLHTGDVAYPEGTFSRYQSYYFDVYRDIMRRAPFYPSPGNHEFYADGGKAYRASIVVPTEGIPVADRNLYYSMDWGNVHFVSLNTNYDTPGPAQPMLDWLERDLQATRQPWKILYWHHPPYDAVRGGESVAIWVRQIIVPLVDRYGVQLVLNGHQHDYLRSKPLRGGVVVPAEQGTVYVITGGGGGFLYDIVPDPLFEKTAKAYHYVRADVQTSKITLQAVGIDGRTIIDSLTLAPPPSLTAGAALNAASFEPLLAPGGLVSIFGRNLAFDEQRARAFPLPEELAGTSVTWNGKPLPLVFVSPYQINAQLPFGAQGNGTLGVKTPNGQSEIAVTLSEAAPGVFTLDGASSVGAILRPDYSLVSPSNPAQPGEILSAYLTCMGSVRGNILEGQAAPASPLMPVTTPTQVQVANQTIDPVFAGLAPGNAGLYQVNFQLPEGLGPGRWSLRVVMRGARSNTVLLPVLGEEPRNPDDLQGARLARPDFSSFTRYLTNRLRSSN